MYSTCGCSSTISYRVFIAMCGTRLTLHVYLYVLVHALAVKFHPSSLYLGDSQIMLDQNKCSLNGISFFAGARTP